MCSDESPTLVKLVAPGQVHRFGIAETPSNEREVHLAEGEHLAAQDRTIEAGKAAARNESPLRVKFW